MDTGANNNQAEQTENKPVTFSEEQQARVNELIKEKMGEAAKTVRSELNQTKAELDALKARLTEAEAASKGAKTKDEKHSADADVDAIRNQLSESKSLLKNLQDEVERTRKQLHDKDKEVTSARQEALNVRKQVALQGSATKANFVDLDAVIALTDRYIKFDEERNRFVVLNEEGGERFNSAMELMSLDEYYREFATKKPYLVRGDVKGGSGSSESGRFGTPGTPKIEELFGPKSDASKANQFALKDPEGYKRMRAQAKAAKLIS
jgi:predicted RNase H-like nuclease (RuvC/YqgF family)